MISDRKARQSTRAKGAKFLRVMKFGGTSLGDASCIDKAIEIVRSHRCEGDLVVVVSAMSGVTNKLIAAATRAEAGDESTVQSFFEELRQQHSSVVNTLIESSEERQRVDSKMQELFQEGERLCQGTMLLRELTPRVRDSISGLGERLAAPIVSAVLSERGAASEAIEATELIETDSCHGAADPCLAATQKRCESRLRSLLQAGITPIVTGFIGATEEGVLTTLGRGGSDYSATILGAALNADEVIIWTDVDGLMTADPRLVPGARTLPEISYREASELAFFGAKVLHPKTLRPVMQSGIPLWIRNTFSPEQPGTRITPDVHRNGYGVKALTALKDVALITVGGPGLLGVTDVVGRAFATISAVRADVLLISQSSSRNDICLAVPAAVAKHTVEALRREFAHDLAHEGVEHIAVDGSVAIVAVVGQKLPGSVARTFGILERERIDVIAIAQGSSDCNLAFVVAQKDMKAALTAIHEELQLAAAPISPFTKYGNQPAAWYSETPRASAEGD